MIQEQELLKEALYALNNMLNHKGVCMDGSSSYDLAIKIDRFLKSNLALIHEQHYLNNPDKLIYSTCVNGEQREYTYRTILALAKNNGTYALSLIDRADRKSIEQMISDDYFNEKIIAFQDTFKMLNENY